MTWGWFDDPEGVIDKEYFPSFLGEENTREPKSTYSFAQIFAFSFALTLEARLTAKLVKTCVGLGSEFSMIG